MTQIQVAFASLLASALLISTDAESIYSGYFIQATRNVSANSANSANQCINLCLQDSTCSAITYCSVSGSFICTLTSCGDIRLQANSACSTIVFADINLKEGVDFPLATYEWILTDACTANVNAACFSNTGSYFGSSISASSSSGATSWYSQPSCSYFYGNAMSPPGLNLTATGVQVDFSGSLSVFLWIKLVDVAQNFIIANFTSTSTWTSNAAAYWLVGNYANGTISIQISNPVLSFSSGPAKFSPGYWHYIAYTSDPANNVSVFYIDAGTKLIINRTISLPSTNYNSYTLSVWSLQTGVASINCYRIFSVVLRDADIGKLAQSCQVGKLSFVNASTTQAAATTTTTKSCPNATWSLDNTYYYVFNSLAAGIDAYQMCLNNSLSPFKPQSAGELMYISQVILPAVPNSFVWANAYGFLGNVIWLKDNSTAITSTYAWTADGCCSIDVRCWALGKSDTTVKFEDAGCYGTAELQRPFCTCSTTT